ncbi:hypothetical protein Tco_0201440 [Tanacetum coccineum]
MFFKYSTCLIHPKKSRGRAVNEDLPEEPTKPKQKPSKVTHATKEPVALKKVTASSKKKLTKRKLVLSDETDISEKNWNQTYDSSGKLKGIEILSNVAQFEIDTLKAQKANRHESRLQPHVGGSSEGTGSKPRVPDELTGKSVGSTDEEVFHVVPRDENPKSPPSDLSDNDDLNESEDDDDERVETDDDRDDDEEEVDRSTDIKETDAESTESDDEHQGKGDADMNIEQEVEKEIQSLSSGFANQFLFNSPNASLLGTITEPAEGDITSIMDVPIQQDVPTVVLEPLNVVTVTVIPEATQAPPPPPAVTTVTLTTQVPNTVAVSFVVQRFSKMKQFVKQLKETNFGSVIHDSITLQVPSIVDKYLGSSVPDAFRKELLANNAALKKELSELNYKEVIKESVEAHVVKEVKNLLPQIFPKAVSDFATPIIEESVKAHAVNEDIIKESVKAHAIAKSLISLAQSSSSHQSAIETAKSLSELELKQILYDKMLKSGSSCSHQTHEELFNALTWSIKLDESISTQSTKPDPIPKKRDRGDDDKDEDPSAGSNQGKETNKMRTRKETESLQKSSNPKESSRVKPPSKPSKSRKSRSANDVVEETVFEMGLYDNDWYKKYPSLEPQDPDWNTVKKINDAQEQPWFKEKVNAAIPPLTFDELMSTPIDFSAFAMNRLGLKTLSREVLVGPVFNLLKGTYKSYGELEYNFEECFCALTDQLDWTNPEGYDRPDMGKPLPLIEKDCRLTIPVEIFFNNDLEYLKGDKAKRTYCSPITKMPAARYTMEGIEDLIPNLWCSMITTYEKDALLGIKHWRSQRPQFYRAMINKKSKHKVFLKLRIMSVISVMVEKKLGYGYLKEIVIKRVDQQQYKFKEGHFPDLNLSDIEDMLLLIAQQKINNLDGDVIVDFVTALKMFTRSIVVQRVEEVYDGILYSVHKTLHTRLQNLNLGFNPKSDMPNRAWSTKDQERTSTILKKIDVVLLKRRITRSLEVLVGGRKTKMDKRLL